MSRSSAARSQEFMQEPVDATKLAREFSLVLASWLTADQITSICKLNRLESNKAICHSHDFCEPNEAMLQAFIEAVGREYDHQSDSDAHLADVAWDLARAADFNPDRVQTISAHHSDIISHSNGHN